MIKHKTYDAVDVAKWIGAWLVMYIHLVPVCTNIPLVDTYMSQGFCRVAVPFYFSVSAFLLFQKMEDVKSCAKQNGKMLWKFCKNILILYTIWVMVYIGYELFYRNYNNHDQQSVVQYVKEYLFSGVRYHLWYLMSSVYAVPLVYLLWRCGKGALIVGCLIGNLLQLIDQLYQLCPIIDLTNLMALKTEFNLLIFAFIRATPMMCLGLLCLKDHEKRSSRQWLLRTAAAVVLVFVEITGWLALRGEKSTGIDGLFCNIFLVYYLTNWLFTVDFKLPVKWLGKALRYSSTWIYCSHVLLILLYGWVLSYEGIFRYAFIGTLAVVSGIPYVAGKILWENHHKKAVKQNDNREIV